VRNPRAGPSIFIRLREFGTYGPLRMLAGLRAENQAHHWGTPNASSTIRSKTWLTELFCPASIRWRSQVIDSGLWLAKQAQMGLLQVAPG
jgi:hypothetical protein